MRNTPDAAFIRSWVKPMHIAGLGHRGICKRPDQRSYRDICGSEHDAISQGDGNHARPGSEGRDIHYPSRRRPGKNEYGDRQTTQREPCHGSGGGAQLGKLALRGPRPKHTFDDVPQHFTEQHVPRLDSKRVHGPEAALSQSKQCAPSDPPNGDQRQKNQNGPDPVERGCDRGGNLADPSGSHKGARPSVTAGITISSSDASASLGRLTSIARLPASESSDRRLVLDQSSSISPRRGSMNHLINCLCTRSRVRKK